MKKEWINSERVVSIVAFFFLNIAFIVSLYSDGDPDSVLELIPHNPELCLTQIILPIIHGIAVIWCFFQIFKPSLVGECGIMLIESLVTILTGTELLGIFLFYGAVCLYQIAQASNQKKSSFVYVFIVIHFLVILTTFSKGWKVFALSAGTSAFYLSFLLWIYHLLRVKFSCFLPKTVIASKLIKEQPGSVLHLKDYNLTDRQIGIVIDYLHDKTSYKDLAEKYITSLSSIKKDFSIVFQKFNVSNIQEMSFLLMQYQIEP